jgi:hypothetical protein
MKKTKDNAKTEKKEDRQERKMNSWHTTNQSMRKNKQKKPNEK